MGCFPNADPNFLELIPSDPALFIILSSSGFDVLCLCLKILYIIFINTIGISFYFSHKFFSGFVTAVILATQNKLEWVFPVLFL